MTNPDSGRLVQSTRRSLQVLEFIEARGSARLTDVAIELEIGYSTAHNHLATLQHEGLLVEEGGVYKLGMKLLKYGSSASRNIPHIQIIRRHITELADRLELELEFLVEERGRVVSIIDTGHTLTKYSTADSNLDIGNFYPMTCTASGKAILAEMTDERVDEVLDTWGLPAATPHSITDRETLYAELEQIREQGYSRADQEILEGFDNIGVAIRDPTDAIIGAVTVGWPTYHFEDEIPQHVLNALLEMKAHIRSEIEATQS
ncbi:MAG: IclR family transcriptional regulator [Halobacteriota archaeon]